MVSHQHEYRDVGCMPWFMANATILCYSHQWSEYAQNQHSDVCLKCPSTVFCQYGPVYYYLIWWNGTRKTFTHSLAHSTASFQCTWLKIVSSWPTSAADHCDPLMSWCVPQREHVRVSKTGVFHNARLCLWNSLPVTLRDRDISLVLFETFKDTLVCLGLQRIVTVVFCAVYNSYLLTYSAVIIQNS